MRELVQLVIMLTALVLEYAVKAAFILALVWAAIYMYGHL